MNSGLGVGVEVVLGLASGVPTGSGWTPVGWRSASTPSMSSPT